MRMSILTWLIVMISFSVATASPLRDQLRQQINTGDHAAAKQTVADADAQFRAGKISADDLRDIFIHLSRSHPNIVDFVRDWATEEPQNPHAMIARAWSLFEAANNVGAGDNTASRKIARAMREELSDLATRAYRLDPKLIPASDAMVRRLGHAFWPSDMPMNVLEKVMTEQPNYGTLLRALPMMVSSDEGTFREFCAYFSKKMPMAKVVQTKHRCLMWGAANLRIKSLASYGRKHLWSDEDDPEIRYEKLRIYRRHVDAMKMSREQVQTVRDIFMKGGFNQFEIDSVFRMSGYFDTYTMPRFHDLVLLGRFQKSQEATIKAFLEDDPYYLPLIDIYEGLPFAGVGNVIKLGEDQFEIREEKPEMTEAEEQAWFKARGAHVLEMAKSRIKASPYSHMAWSNIGVLLRSGGEPEDMFRGDKAAQNGVAFADNPVPMINKILTDKAFQVDILQQIDKGLVEPTESWRQAAETIDRPRQILCPFLRAYRLRELHCRRFTQDKEGCRFEATAVEASFNIIRDMAMAAPECSDILSASQEDLAYTPIPYEKAVPE